MVSLEFDGLGAGEIKRRTEVIGKVLNRPTAELNRGRCSLPLNIPSESASADNLAERTGVS